MSTDPFLTAERRALANTVRDFTTSNIADDVADWERLGELPLSLQQQAADLGLLGIGFDESMGGSGGDAVDMTIMIEQILYAGGTGGVIAGMLTHGIATPHIADEIQRRRDTGDVAGANYLLERFVQPVLSGTAIAA